MHLCRCQQLSRELCAPDCHRRYGKLSVRLWADQSIGHFEQCLSKSSTQTVNTLQACCNSLTEGNALASFSERYVVTAVKSYEAFENVVPLDFQNTAIVAA